MLIDGPREWAEAGIPAGTKLNILKHAYNARIGVGAFPRAGTVALVRYESSPDGAMVVPIEEVLESSVEEIKLHQSAATDASKPAVYRHVCWFSTSQRHLLAIGTIDRVEIWQVNPSESLQATLLGTLSKNRIRVLAWNTVRETLCILTDAEIVFLDVAANGSVTAVDVSVATTGRRISQFKQCGWSPCGLVLARSNDREVQFLTWPSSCMIVGTPPTVASHRMDTKLHQLMDIRPGSGSITAFALLSASVGVVITDIPLVLNEMMAPTPKEPQSSPVFSASTTTPSSGNLIDLTSLRITASQQSALRILDPPTTPSEQVPVKKYSSQLSILTSSRENQWQESERIPIPHLSLPDVVDLEAMRVVIGSTIANRIISIHLDHTADRGWSASVSGELELQDGSVCRGLRLAKTSPFVQVASTEKAKKSFFSACSGRQRINLSKFKVPRRQRPETPPCAATAPATPAEASTPTNSDVTLLTTLLSRIDLLQSAMTTRFDQLQHRLDAMVTRLDRLEVQNDHHSVAKCGGPCLHHG